MEEQRQGPSRRCRWPQSRRSAIETSRSSLSRRDYLPYMGNSPVWSVPPEATTGSARAQNRMSRRAAGRLPLLSPPLSRSPHDLGPSSHGPRVTALLEGPLLSRVPARRISTREIGGRSHGMACKVVARKHTHGVGGRHCTHASQARTLTSRDLARPKTRSRDPLRLERPALAPASRPIAYKV